LEFVLVVPRNDLFVSFYPQGMLLEEEINLDEFLGRIKEKAFFIERRYTEKNPLYKQIIPYCLIIKPSTKEIFLMQRLETQGEKRLHGKLSVGVGGHINPIDEMEGGNFLEIGLKREIEEEVVVEGEKGKHLIGIINDDSNPVGAVHFGLVYALLLDKQGNVEVREKHAMKGSLLPLEQVVEMCNNSTKFESWSEAVLKRSKEWSKKFF